MRRCENSTRLRQPSRDTTTVCGEVGLLCDPQTLTAILCVQGVGETRGKRQGPPPPLSHIMYLFISFRKSTPPQSVNLSFIITNTKNKLTNLCGN